MDVPIVKEATIVIYVRVHHVSVSRQLKKVLVEPNFTGNIHHCSNVDDDIITTCNYFYVSVIYLCANSKNLMETVLLIILAARFPAKKLKHYDVVIVWGVSCIFINQTVYRIFAEDTFHEDPYTAFHHGNYYTNTTPYEDNRCFNAVSDYCDSEIKGNDFCLPEHHSVFFVTTIYDFNVSGLIKTSILEESIF